MTLQTENFGSIYDEVYPEGCILMAYRGSVAHGMYVPGTDPHSIDDIDLMGVYVESPAFYKGIEFKSLGYGGKKTDSQEYFIEQYDVVNYEIRKFFGLLMKGNPNVLTLPFLADDKIIFKHPVWNDIVENREVFVSKKAYTAFKGYARSQIRKMNASVVGEDGVERVEYQGYQGARRRELVDKFGYDTKNAAHLIRILRMGVEFLKRGHLSVDRSGIDADELMDIKTGGWTLAQVRHEAELWEEYLDQQWQMSKLPEKVDLGAANKLLVGIIDKYYNELKGQG